MTEIKMTLKELSHKYGLISVQRVVDITKVPRSTLQCWRINKPQLLNIVLLGCAERIKRESIPEKNNV